MQRPEDPASTCDFVIEDLNNSNKVYPVFIKKIEVSQEVIKESEKEESAQEDIEVPEVDLEGVSDYDSKESIKEISESPELINAQEVSNII